MYPYISFFGKSVSTYGLFMAVAVALVCYLSSHDYRKSKQCAEDFMIISALAVGCGLLSAYICYILVTYSLSELLWQIRNGNFLLVNGGLVYYGGLFGGILGGSMGVYWTHSRFDFVEEAVVPYLPLGHAIGRIGCLMAGCCYGCAYEGPFAVHYSHSLYGLPMEQGYFPIQILEAVLNIGTTVILLRLRKRVKKKGDLLILYLCLYSVMRFVLEYFRGDAIRGSYYIFSTSQWISIFLIVCCGIYCLTAERNQRKTKASL